MTGNAAIPFANAPPGGECYRDVYERVTPWLRERDLSGDIVVIAHRMLIAAACDSDPELLVSMPISQDAICLIEDGSYRMVDTGDTEDDPESSPIY